MIYLNFNIKDIYITEKHHLYKFCNNIKYELEIKNDFTHKIYISDKKNNMDYVFNYYSEIMNISIINKIFKVLRCKKLYDKVMENKKYFYDIKIEKKDIKYCHPFDYPFPNVNFLFYNMNKKEIWIDRIRKLYFNYLYRDNSYGWYDFSCSK